MFKTELHLHTREVSTCCDTDTAVSAARYLKAGYTTVTVTDHYNPALCRRIPDVAERVEFFTSGYRAFCRELEGKATVLFGFELCLTESYNDYLVYGLGADFLIANPNLCEMARPDVIEAIHAAGGMIYQAHPFRNRMTVMDPKGLDGIEIFNAHNTHDSRNYLAYALAKQEKLSGIAGTDFHHPHHWPAAGIVTADAILSTEELLNVLRAGTYHTFGEIIPKDEVLASLA